MARVVVGSPPPRVWERVALGHEARGAVQAMAATARGRRSLRAVVATLGAHDVGRHEVGEIVERVLQALSSGRCRVHLPVRLRAAFDPSVSVEPPQPAVGPGPVTTAPPPDEPAPLEEHEDWIEIELVDEAQGLIGRRSLLLELADGSSRTAETDAFGVARITGLPPGPVTVTFLDVDERELIEG